MEDRRAAAAKRDGRDPTVGLYSTSTLSTLLNYNTGRSPSYGSRSWQQITPSGVRCHLALRALHVLCNMARKKVRGSVISSMVASIDMSM